MSFLSVVRQLDKFDKPQKTQQIPFRQQFTAECIEGSAIAPELFATTVQFTEDERGGEVYGLLGWKYSRFWQFRKPHDFGVFAGFYGEDGDLWQGKAEHHPDWMDGKYLGPKRGARAFLPALPNSIRRLLGIPLDSSAWEAIAADSSIPLVLTEGGKKGLCGLSHGYATIASFGVDAFSRKGEHQLLPELRQLIDENRQIIIAFDKDDKRKTRRRVRAATARLCRYLVDSGAKPENICIAQWEPSQGKGLDDLVVQSGADALHEAIAKAEPYPAWKRGGWSAYLEGKYPEIFELIHKPARELNQQYLPELTLPRDGGLLAISSPMGTGKTEIMKGLIRQVRGIAGKNTLIELIGYRNSLGRQSASKDRLDIDHIRDLEGNEYSQTFINASLAIAYCLDSLHRRIDAVRQGIAQGKRVLILLDEIDAVLKHLLLGSTLGKRRGDIALMLCDLLKRVADSGGWIVAGEADLLSLPINFLESVTGKAAQVVVNRWQGSPWQVEMPMPLNQKLAASPALMGKAAAQRVLQELEAGKRVAVATDSQQWGETLERMAAARGIGFISRPDVEPAAESVEVSAERVAAGIIRLDGCTAEESWAQQLIAAPDEYLTAAKPQLFIYSPTAESGLSIKDHHFDLQLTYGSHLEHRAIAQLMGRIRQNIPRVVFAREFSLSDESGRITDPAALLKDWHLNARYSAVSSQLGDSAPDLTLEGPAALLHDYAARYQARENLSKTNLRQNLINALVAQGHSVTESIESPLSPDFREELSATREAIEVEAAADFAAKAIDDMTPEVADRILGSHSSKRDQRTVAEKVKVLQNYPGLPVHDAKFVRRNIIKSRGTGLRQHTALFLALHPEVAQQIDQQCWATQAESKILWLPNIKREGPCAKLLQQSGLLALFDLEEYTENDRAVQKVRDFALHYQADIKRVLGLWCAEHHSGIQIVNKLARRVGMVAKIIRRIGPRGAQEKVWGWKRDEDTEGDRAAVLAALLKRWGDFLESWESKGSEFVHSISDSRNTFTEIEDTVPQTPPKFVNWGSERFALRLVEGEIAYLMPLDEHDFPLEFCLQVPLRELELMDAA